jgi:succinyl-diaminopimelate desuccinylase
MNVDPEHNDPDQCMPYDLLLATAALVNIASESHNESAITEHIEERLRAISRLEVTRIDNNLVARTNLGRSQRLVLAGHSDTVPANGNATARIEGDVLHGLGSADMKGGLAVFLALAESLGDSRHLNLRNLDPKCDITFVFYECEEVAAKFNGLKKLFATKPDLIAGDAAILGEPTSAIVEAGCQGTMRAQLTLRGERAHTARPWMGRNAIHRLSVVLDRLRVYEGRQPVIDGCTFREAMQAVRVEGGVAGNVVPDLATLTMNHRFAPDRSIQEAEAHIRSVIGDDVLRDEASFEVVDAANAALPSLTHPLLASLVARTGAAPQAKLGWTDVAFFAAQGIPAVNFGPGDPTIAHSAGEFVHRQEIERTYLVLRDLLNSPA